MAGTFRLLVIVNMANSGVVDIPNMDGASEMNDSQKIDVSYAVGTHNLKK